MHDDVEVHDAFFADKLVKAHEQYDVVGLAGTRTMNLQSPALWHHMSKDIKSDGCGFVSHYFPDKGLNSAFFGYSPSKALLIDGLFISVDMKKIRDTKCKFDEEFDFHFYDLAFSLQCYLHDVSVGVWPIFVVHYGLGEPDKNWKELETKFLSKYTDLFNKKLVE